MTDDALLRAAIRSLNMRILPPHLSFDDRHSVEWEAVLQGLRPFRRAVAESLAHQHRLNAPFDMDPEIGNSWTTFVSLDLFAGQWATTKQAPK